MLNRTVLPLLLLLPLALAQLKADGQQLEYDPDEPIWEEEPIRNVVSDLTRMVGPDDWGKAVISRAASIKELSEPRQPTNGLDFRVKDHMKHWVVDEILWGEIMQAKQANKGKGFELSSTRNAEIHYSYICPLGRIGYSLSWEYKLVETEHGDWEKLANGTKPSCTFTLVVSGIHVDELRTIDHTDTISLTANQFVNSHNVTVTVVRGDDWPRFHEQLENPTFTALPIEIPPSFSYPEIFKAFTNITALFPVARFHSRCEHIKDSNETFYKDLCPLADHYGGERAFYGREEYGSYGKEPLAYEESALNMHALLRNLLPDSLQVCNSDEVAPARLYVSHQGFVQHQDVPSLFAIDQVKVRAHYERYHDFPTLAAWHEAEDQMEKPEKFFTRHLDEADLIMALVRGDELHKHLSEADKKRIKKNQAADCDFFDNAKWRYREFEAGWFESIWLWIFYPSYDKVNCEGDE